MKKSVIALILLAALVIIVSPGIVGKLAEDSVGENLNWAAEQSGSEIVVTSEGFDRGWFSSEGQHRVALRDGQLSDLIGTSGGGDEIPSLLINTRIDHGIIPVSSMSRDEGSLAPGLGSAVSTLSIDLGNGETIDLPGTIYSNVGMGGNLDSRYILGAGSEEFDGGTASWDDTEVRFVTSASTGDIEFDGEIGALAMGDDEGGLSIDGIRFSGDQKRTEHGFHVGDMRLTMGEMTIEVAGAAGGGVESVKIDGETKLDGDAVDGNVHVELNRYQVPAFGEVSLVTDISARFNDAEIMGRVTRTLNGMASSGDPTMLMMESQEQFKDLFAAGLAFNIEKFDLALPMGTLESVIAMEVPSMDRDTFEWTSLLLQAVAEVDLKIPEALVDMATAMNPEAGMAVGMGFLKKEGDVYIMAADYKQGLLTVNGAPVPIPMGAFQ